MTTELKKYTDTLLVLNEKFEGVIEKDAFVISFENNLNQARTELVPSIKIMVQMSKANTIIKMVVDKFAADDYQQSFTDNGYIKILTYIDDVQIDLTLA